MLHMADSNLNPGLPREANRVCPMQELTKLPLAQWERAATCIPYLSLRRCKSGAGMGQRQSCATSSTSRKNSYSCSKKLLRLPGPSRHSRAMCWTPGIQCDRMILRSPSKLKLKRHSRGNLSDFKPRSPSKPKLTSSKRVQKGAKSMTGPATSPKTWRRHAVSGRSERIRRLRRPHRAVSMRERDMAWTWLEPDGAALRLGRLCRQGRVLLAEWRGLCVRA